MAKLKLSAPWNTFYKEIRALFGDDPQINVFFDEDAGKIKMYVDNAEKADAIGKLLPNTKTFGTVTVGIEVIPANGEAAMVSEEPALETLFTKAFDKNPALSFIKAIDCPMGHIVYVVFANKVVQFFNDNLFDIYGNKSTLYQDIANDVIDEKWVAHYCTDVGGANVAWPY